MYKSLCIANICEIYDILFILKILSYSLSDILCWYLELLDNPSRKEGFQSPLNGRETQLDGKRVNTEQKGPCTISSYTICITYLRILWKVQLCSIEQRNGPMFLYIWNARHFLTRHLVMRRVTDQFWDINCFLIF